LRFGVFDVMQVPGVYGAPLERIEKEQQVDIDGMLGVGVLAGFRLTFSDGGRVLWVEQVPPPPPGPELMPLPPEMLGPGGMPGMGPGSDFPSFMPGPGPGAPMPGMSSLPSLGLTPPGTPPTRPPGVSPGVTGPEPDDSSQP
jgi:hypothetical protein